MSNRASADEFSTLGLYHPPNSTRLDYDERHRIHPNLLKRFENRQWPTHSTLSHSTSCPSAISSPARLQPQRASISLQNFHGQCQTVTSNGAPNSEARGNQFGSPTDPTMYYDSTLAAYAISHLPTNSPTQPRTTASTSLSATHGVGSSVSQDFQLDVTSYMPSETPPAMSVMQPATTVPTMPLPMASFLTNAVARAVNPEAVHHHTLDENSFAHSHHLHGPTLSRSGNTSPSTAGDSSSPASNRTSTSKRGSVSASPAGVKYSPYQQMRRFEGKPLHQPQTIAIDGGSPTSSTGRPSSRGEKEKKDSKKPFLACEFCRNRKIACGPGPTLPADITLPPGPRTCNQCHRRGYVCKFPEASRRGLRHGRPSRRVIYGPDNQYRIVNPDDLENSDEELEWEDFEDPVSLNKKLSSQKRAGGNSNKYPARPWSPIRFVAAVDSDVLKELAERGVISPGGYA